MALSWYDLGITMAINVGLAAAYVILYSIFSIPRVNARVYFPRWFVKDDEDAKKQYEAQNNTKHSFMWIPKGLKMSEEELVEHAGLDMALYLRMFIMAWKIFGPIMVLSCAVLIPVYITQSPSAAGNPNYVPGAVDALGMGSLAPRSLFFWLVSGMAYLFNFWILFVMGAEFKTAAKMRVDYDSKLKDSAEQFTVLVRQIPAEHSSEAPEATETFFQDMHPYTYQCTQTCYNVGSLPNLEPKVAYKRNRLEAYKIRSEKKGVRPTTSKGCFGPKVDAIELMEEDLQKLDDEIREKQEKVLSDPMAVLPACFVSFNSRRGAAVAAQTLQYHDPAKWVTRWAPEPQDVVWTNLAIPYLQGGVRKMAVAFIVFAIVVGYTVPVGIVQGFASISNLEKLFPFLTPIIEIPFVTALLQGFLPGLALMLFLMFLPPILLGLSKFEGYVAQSEIDRAAAGKHFYFKVVTVFLTNVLLGSAFNKMAQYIDDPASIATELGTAIPNQASFFITFTLINGWAGVASELFRMVPLIIFHVKNMLLVVTEEDRQKAMSPPNPGYFGLVPDLEMYFLFSLMYMVLSPFYLPFAMVYFLWAYVVYRNQFINVYSPAYDLRGGFWPHFHARIIAMLVMAQGVLIIVLGLKEAIGPAVVLLPLPILTLMINNTLIFERHNTVFKRVPLDRATHRDKVDAEAGDKDVRALTLGAYLHPCLQSYQDGDVEGGKGGAEHSKLLTAADETAQEAPKGGDIKPADVVDA